MKNSLIIVFLFSITMVASNGFAQSGVKAKFAADVPASILTPDTVETERLGTLNFFDGMPSEETVQKIYDNLDFLRSVESFLSGMPAASIYGLLEGQKSAGLETYDIGIFEDLMDARTLFLTANSTSMYCFAEINVKAGPTVLEVPPGVLGPVDDAFFRWVTDVGVTGPDKGKGGKYLFLPPGYEGKIPEGYFVVHTKTYRNWLLMRVFVTDGDLAATATSAKALMRLYPISKADNPPAQRFVNLSGKQFNTIHANDFHFFEELNAVIQYEPADAFNPELTGLFASIGIKKGKPFNPDERMKKILSEAVAVGNATARGIAFSPREQDPYFYPDRQWYTAFVGGSHEFIDNGELMLNYRTMMHYLATGITPAMAMSAVGQGSAYAFTPRDSKGRYLDGGQTYKIILPAPIPAKDFWSFMVYSGQHRSMLETDQKLAGLDNLNPTVKQNEDGSYTMWFGPKAPEGHEGNWIQTMPGKSYNVLLRLYGPLEPWFDKTWKPGDFELID
jgi:hypothetical protein